MNIGLEELSEKYYKLRHLVRYQTSPRIHDETVLEHQAVTAAIVTKLRDDYEFDELKAVKLALFHDYAESETSDIPHPIKKKLPPDIQERLEEIEVEIIERDLGHELAVLLRDFNQFDLAGRSPEGKVVALADSYSVLLYAKSESMLGNKEWYEGYVIPYTMRRIGDLERLLEPFRIRASLPTQGRL